MGKLCTECHEEPAEWDFGEDAYCQMCWEAECDRTWWEMMDRIYGVNQEVK